MSARLFVLNLDACEIVKSRNSTLEPTCVSMSFIVSGRSKLNSVMNIVACSDLSNIAKMSSNTLCEDTVLVRILQL